MAVAGLPHGRSDRPQQSGNLVLAVEFPQQKKEARPASFQEKRPALCRKIVFVPANRLRNGSIRLVDGESFTRNEATQSQQPHAESVNASYYAARGQKARAETGEGIHEECDGRPGVRRILSLGARLA